MLLSPLVSPESAFHRRRITPAPPARLTVASARARGKQRSPVPAVLIVWLALGSCVLALVPAARGGVLLGATLPFWLVAAPMLNLLWWRRRECLAALRRCWTMRRRRAASAASAPSRAHLAVVVTAPASFRP